MPTDRHADGTQGVAHPEVIEGIPHADAPLSMPEHVRQRLREAIIEGALSPGQRVSEDELARAFGVSRTPVREAMRYLESEGLLAHRRGRGATIADLATREDAQVLFSVRVPLESALAQRACGHITAPVLRHLRSVHQAFEELALSKTESAADTRRLVELDADFHMSIYRAADASLLLPIVASYWGQLLRELHRRDHDPEHPVQFVASHDKFVRQHAAILAALEQGDGELAGTSMAEHLTEAWQRMRAVWAETSSTSTASPPEA
jgi:DNA-binding GntR family transcriptional regulator